MTDEAEDSGCTSQDPDDMVSIGGIGNNNNNSSSSMLTAAVNSPSKKSKPSSVESSEIPGMLGMFNLPIYHIDPILNKPKGPIKQYLVDTKPM